MSGNERREISGWTECIYGIVTALLFAAAARTTFFPPEQSATHTIIDSAPLLAIGWTMLFLAPHLLPSFRKK